MKFIATFLIVIVSNQALAESDDDKMFIGMAKNFATSYSVNKALEFADAEIEKQIKVGSVATNAFSAYQIFEAGRRFQNSSSDSQRFYSSMEGVSAGLTIWAAPVGFVASLITLGAELFGAMVQSTFANHIAQLQAETAEIVAKISEIQKKEVHADSQYLMSIMTSTSGFWDFEKRLDKNYKRKCASKELIKNFGDFNYCVSALSLERNVLQGILNLYANLKRYPGIYFNYSAYLAITKKTDADIDAFLKPVEQTVTEINAYLDHLNQVIVRLIAEIHQRKFEHSNSYKMAALSNSCRALRYNETAQFISITSELEEAKVKNDTITALLLKAKYARHLASYNSSLNEMCKEVEVDPVDSDLNEIVKELSAI